MSLYYTMEEQPNTGQWRATVSRAEPEPIIYEGYGPTANDALMDLFNTLLTEIEIESEPEPVAQIGVLPAKLPFTIGNWVGSTVGGYRAGYTRRSL